MEHLQSEEPFSSDPYFSEAKEIKKQETLVRFSIISYKTRLRVCMDVVGRAQSPASEEATSRGLST